MTNFDVLHSFLGIPYIERTVPFPNWATVFLQHAHALPDTVALEWNSGAVTYLQLYHWLMNTDEQVAGKPSFLWKPGENGQEILLLFAMLFSGVPVTADFGNRVKMSLPELPDIHSPLLKTMEPNYQLLPYIRQTSPALIVSLPGLADIQFTQYNLMCAAQSLGKTFNLFRPGNVVIHHALTNLSDLVLSLLAPLYFGKSIHFLPGKNPSGIISGILSGDIHYAYVPILPDMQPDTPEEKILRDATLLCDLNQTPLKILAQAPSFVKGIIPLDMMAGTGPVLDHSLTVEEVPASELATDTAGQLSIRGHSLFDSFINSDSDWDQFKNGWIKIPFNTKFQSVTGDNDNVGVTVSNEWSYSDIKGGKAE